ncbi:MAG: hypothetical protein IT379_08485 [Deltaproteobacteria bacterium]|nr:hypothetical protein [Deltaproteobacteria bacterium]
MRVRWNTVATIVSSLVAATLLVVASGCETEHCRYDPDCGGGIGGFCNDSGDCDDGFCCTDESNCAGGICTYRCNDDADCPDDMACEHDKCFFVCNDDSDCASGMSCEHGNTVCEWP